MLKEFEEDVKNILKHLAGEMAKLQMGRASSAMVEDIYVEAYGSMQPIKAVANINIKDAQTIMIQPWDKALIKDVEKGIMAANLGINPQNDGINLFLKIPAPTAERRGELVKAVNIMGEESRIRLRKSRTEAKQRLERQHDSKEISEDELKSLEKKLQEQVDKVNTEIETQIKEKEKQILSI